MCQVMSYRLLSLDEDSNALSRLQQLRDIHCQAQVCGRDIYDWEGWVCSFMFIVGDRGVA